MLNYAYLAQFTFLKNIIWNFQVFTFFNLILNQIFFEKK